MTALNASGSSQFSENTLKRMVEIIPHKKIMIVDLREEDHGFLNGDSISWYKNRNWVNQGKTKEEIIAKEKKRLARLSDQFFTIVYARRDKPVPYIVKNVATEQEIVNRHGLEYYRLPIRDHVRPSNSTVDEFILLVQNLKEETWLHFHCAAGKGRSTTLLTMYQMMNNDANLPLEDIFAMQHFWGGSNLFNEHEEDWRHPYMLERIDFLKKFYRYCQENPEFAYTWSEWSDKNTSPVRGVENKT
jgi:protein-tyrosine phosphatase